MDGHLAHPVARHHLDWMDHQLGVGIVLVRSNEETRDDLGVAKVPLSHSRWSHSFYAMDRKGPGGRAALAVWQPWYLRARGSDACRDLFTWWARIHLGRFWSNAITHKEGHRVIDTGPYGLVRHPIYTGLIAGMLVTGVAVGTITAMLGAVLISLGMWQKARMEEDFLVAELGADAYGSYCRRVPMLIPFLPTR